LRSEKNDNHPILITFIWNVRLNTETRVNRLIDIVTQVSLLEYEHISLRLRGNFRYLASEKISKLVPQEKLMLFIGENYKDWNMNTLEQVLLSDTPYYCVMQEDYLFLSTPDQTNYFLELCIENEVDYAMLFDQNFINTKINNSQTKLNNQPESQYLKTYDYNLYNWDTEAKNYHGSMISWPSFFGKLFLIKILNSPRPYLKRYPPYSPFNFEKNVEQTWILPLWSAHPVFELLGCIDDDIRVPNSSLINRGVYPKEIARIDEQYVGTHSPGRFVFNTLSKLSRFLLNSSSLANKIQSPRLLSIYTTSVKILYNNLRFVDSLKFSIIYFYNRFSNISERRLRNSSKKFIR
jgi:hypothetical protein